MWAEDLEALCQLQHSWPNPLADSYVEGIVNLHYKMDEAVKEDLELQTWCREITEIGLRGAQNRGKLNPCPEASNLRDSSLETPQNSPYIYGTFQKHVQPL